MLSSSLNRRVFIIIALSLGLISMVRAIPVRAKTIEIEGGNGLVISGEFTGTVAETPVTPTSDEGTFITPSAPVSLSGVGRPVRVTEETLRNLTLSRGDETGPSGEGTFITLALPDIQPPDDNDGDDNDNNGGGGGGGGRSRKKTAVATTTPATTTVICQPYLLKFIRFGAANDPNEVRKLQVFLRDFQKMDVPIDGFYGEATFEAVKIFQLRYAKDILKPWGVDYATGYVYITTTLAINNLYCERDPANNLDLRSRLKTPLPAFLDVLPATTTSTSTPFLEIGEATNTSRLMLAALGLFNFFKLIPGWWWILILLCIISYLLFELRTTRRQKQDQPNNDDGGLTS